MVSEMAAFFFAPLLNLFSLTMLALLGGIGGSGSGRATCSDTPGKSTSSMTSTLLLSFAFNASPACLRCVFLGDLELILVLGLFGERERSSGGEGERTVGLPGRGTLVTEGGVETGNSQLSSPISRPPRTLASSFRSISCVEGSESQNKNSSSTFCLESGTGIVSTHAIMCIE